MSTLAPEKIEWRTDVESAREEAQEQNKMVLVELLSPKCMGCQNMEKRTFSDDNVAQTIEEQFVPVHYDVLSNPDMMKPFMSFWTPAVIAQCPDGNTHRKWLGFLPPKQFLGELALARVNYAIARQSFDEAHRLAQDAVQITSGDELRHSEALYWQAVAAYKASDNQELLIAGWKDLLERFPNSEWATKVDFAANL